MTRSTITRRTLSPKQAAFWGFRHQYVVRCKGREATRSWTLKGARHVAWHYSGSNVVERF